jgi:hypothetical protein
VLRVLGEQEHLGGELARVVAEHPVRGSQQRALPVGAGAVRDRQALLGDIARDPHPEDALDVPADVRLREDALEERAE